MKIIFEIYLIEEISIRIVPNPASGKVGIYYDHIVDNAEMYLMDLQGRVVLQETLSSYSGKVDWNTAAFEPGIYLVTLKSGDKQQTEKLVIIK